MRIYLLFGALYLSYLGYDGIGGNQELVKTSVDDIVKNGVGDNRYLEISGCFSTGAIVYEYEESKPTSVDQVYFPVIPKEDFYAKFIGELSKEAATKTKVHVIVKRDKTKYKPECIGSGTDDHTCLDDIVDFDSDKYLEDGLVLKGTVRVGADEIGQKKLDLFKTINYEIADNLILVEENETMRGKFLSWLMLIGGMIISLGILGSYLYKKDQGFGE